MRLKLGNVDFPWITQLFCGRARTRHSSSPSFIFHVTVPETGILSCIFSFLPSQKLWEAAICALVHMMFSFAQSCSTQSPPLKRISLISLDISSLAFEHQPAYGFPQETYFIQAFPEKCLLEICQDSTIARSICSPGACWATGMCEILDTNWASIQPPNTLAM